jgi:hypothetical protein
METHNLGENMDQVPVQLFESACKKAKIYVANDMSLGAFHDFLLNIKSMMIDRMVKVQKDEQELAAAKKQEENPECQSQDCGV